MELGTEYQFALTRKATSAGGIDSLESIPGLLKSLKIQAVFYTLTPLFSYPPHGLRKYFESRLLNT